MRKLILMVWALTSFMAAKADFITTTSENLHVWAEFPTIVADGETVNYITIYEHDDDNLKYTAFNMELLLPEGFRVNQVRQGRAEVDDIFLSERAHPTHSIACNIVDGVDLRIIADSTNNEDFYDDDESGNPMDELFTIGLIADPSLAAGEYLVQLTGIKFVLSNADATVPANEPIDYTIVVKHPIHTSITEVDAEDLVPGEYYDLSGRRIDPAKVHGAVVVSKDRKFLVK